MSANANQARAWVRAHVLAFALGLFVVIVMNLALNPEGYFPWASLHASSWQSRALKLELAAKYGRADGLILGSSRTMQVNPEVLETQLGGRFFNACVDSAAVEDICAFADHAKDDLRWNLKWLVIGLDVEALHNGKSPDGRLNGAAPLRRKLPPAMQLELAGVVTRSVLSWQTTRDSLRALRDVLQSAAPQRETRFLANGNLQYTRWEEQRQAHTFEPPSDWSAKAYAARFAGYTEVDEFRSNLLEECLSRHAAAGTEIFIYVTPLHDHLRAELRSVHYDERRAETHALLSELTQKAEMRGRLHVADYSDVRSFGGDPSGFYDGAHVFPESADRLSAEIADALRVRLSRAVQ